MVWDQPMTRGGLRWVRRTRFGLSVSRGLARSAWSACQPPSPTPCTTSPADASGTHRAPPSTEMRVDEAAVLPSPAVVLSARLQQYYGRLRRPPSTKPTSRRQPVIGPASPVTTRRSPGRGGPPQFPSLLSERSTPHTPEGSWRLRFQVLHRVHGLHRDFSGSAPPAPTLTGGPLTTLQASRDAADRSFAPPSQGFRRCASTPGVSPRRRQPATGASWQLPGPDSHRQATTS